MRPSWDSGTCALEHSGKQARRRRSSRKSVSLIGRCKEVQRALAHLLRREDRLADMVSWGTDRVMTEIPSELEFEFCNSVTPLAHPVVCWTDA